MKLNLNIFDRILQIRYFKVPNAPVIGYTSKTEDGFHCLFLDYDMISPDIVYSDLNNLFEKELITHAYIFSTYEEDDELGKVGNYHVICLDKFYFNDILKIMELTHSDSLHRDLAKKTRYRGWVLRLSGKGDREKPKFIKFLINGFRENKVIQSQAHYKLIHTLNEIDDSIFRFNFDNINKVKLTYYNSSSKLNEKEVKKHG